MIARNMALMVAGLLLVTARAANNVVAREAALLNVAQGQIPNDTGSDGATTMAIEECFSDIWLVGDDLPAGRAVGVAGRAAVYHIKGTIGSDKARLARIRAAKMPPITKPILFCTPQADAICSALEVFPADNPWNQVVSDWPLHPNSKNIIASIGP